MSIPKELKIIWAVLALVMAVGLATALLVMRDEGYYGIVQERAPADFELTSHDGSRVRLADFRGKVVLVFFGYTHCPDICPTTMTTLSRVTGLLGDDARRVQVLFVTLDPVRDSVPKLEAYVPFYDEGFLGLTGTTEEIEAAASVFNVYWQVEEKQGDALDYLISHTSSFFLVAPDGGRLLRYTQSNSDPELIARDIAKVLKKYG